MVLLMTGSTCLLNCTVLGRGSIMNFAKKSFVMLKHPTSTPNHLPDLYPYVPDLHPKVSAPVPQSIRTCIHTYPACIHTYPSCIHTYPAGAGA